MQPTIGQRILAAVIAHKMGIATDRVLKLYISGREIDPSWEEVGEYLLKDAPASTTAPGMPCLAKVVSITRPNGSAE
jgi:hypothetical protein